MKALGIWCFLSVLAVSFGGTAFAQLLIESKYEPLVRQAFDDRGPGVPPLDCTLTPIQPTLDFSLRFKTGYVMDLPLSQFSGPHRVGVVLLRVTPEGGVPVYLVSRVDIPDGTRANRYRRSMGGFVVGDGRYNVEVVVKDDINRTCQSRWLIEAKRDAPDRSLRLAMPPLTVAGLSSSTRFDRSRVSQPDLNRLTILLHVEPPSPNLARLPAGDALKLLGSLSVLLEQVHAKSVRLVIFDLEQQKVLFRKDGSTAADMNDVAKLINSVQFGSVDYSVLRSSRTAMDLLTHLTEEELGQLQPSDALVFLGPSVQVHGTLAPDLGKKPRGLPRVFYLECRPPVTFATATRSAGLGFTAESATAASYLPGDQDDVESVDHLSALDQWGNVMPDGETFLPAEQRDSVEQWVRRLKGETILIRKPGDCARAIQRILRRAEPQSSGVQPIPDTK